MPTLTIPSHLVPRQARALWAAEELALLLQEYEAWPTYGTKGFKAPGMMQRLETLFPQYSWTQIKSQLRRFTKAGTLPRKRTLSSAKRSTPSMIGPLVCLPTELAWLAGILDGEGSVGFVEQSRREHGPKAARLTLCTNTDQALLQEVLRLVPFAKMHRTNRAGAQICRGNTFKYNKDVYVIAVTSQAGMFVVLSALRSYVRGVKRVRLEAVLQYVTSRLEASCL